MNATTALTDVEGRILRPASMRDADLRALRVRGLLAPYGDGNAKTAAYGTYRPVGASCPASCPMLNRGCYAQKGHAGMAQRRASVHIISARNALMMAIYASKGAPVRLHVSGDLGQTWDDAAVMVEEYVEVARHYRGGPDNVLAWGYTALPRTPQGEALVKRLAEHGIILRWSNSVGAGCATVGNTLLPRRDDPWADRDAARASLRAEARALTAQGAPTMACPAQLSERVTCASCRACWSATDRGVLFARH